jgi:hypothetical protein
MHLCSLTELHLQSLHLGLQRRFSSERDGISTSTFRDGAAAWEVEEVRQIAYFPDKDKDSLYIELAPRFLGDSSYNWVCEFGWDLSVRVLMCELSLQP